MERMDTPVAKLILPRILVHCGRSSSPSCMISRVCACEEHPYQGVQLNRKLRERRKVHSAIMLSTVPLLATHHDCSGRLCGMQSHLQLSHLLAFDLRRDC